MSAATSATLAPSASPMGSVKAFILAGLLRVITATCTVECVQYSTVQHSKVQFSHGHLALALVVEADEAAGGGAASRLETSGWEAEAGQEPCAAHRNVHVCYCDNTITINDHVQSRSRSEDDGEVFLGPTRSFPI